MKVGDKVHFKKNYILNSGIIFTPKAKGAIVKKYWPSDASPACLDVNFEILGIVFPIDGLYESAFEKITRKGKKTP